MKRRLIDWPGHDRCLLYRPGGLCITSSARFNRWIFCDSFCSLMSSRNCLRTTNFRPARRTSFSPRDSISSMLSTNKCRSGQGRWGPDRHHRFALTDLLGCAENRCAAKTVPDENPRRPGVLPEEINSLDQVFRVRTEVGVGKLPVAAPQAGSQSAEPRFLVRPGPCSPWKRPPYPWNM